MPQPSAMSRLFARLRRAISGAPANAAADCDQVAALIWRDNDGITEVLLVTSRGTGRWILPKGWIEPGEDRAEAAAREAWEEAGAEGVMASAQPIGQYSYDKFDADGASETIGVSVHAMALTRLADDWPEKGQRDRRWMRCAEAVRQVHEPDLKTVIAAFAIGGRERAA